MRTPSPVPWGTSQRISRDHPRRRFSKFVQWSAGGGEAAMTDEFPPPVLRRPGRECYLREN